jgi:integrase
MKTMAKATKDLTTKRVEALREPGRYHDPEHRGLYLQVGPTGTKSWLLRYEHGGRERWHGLGSARDFSLAEARKRARAKRQLLADGLDPIEVKITAKDAAAKEARARLTFERATHKFLKLYAETWRNDKHRAQWRSTLKEHAFPKLGDRSVASIDSAMVNDAIADIWSKAPETARRTKQRIERVIQWVKDGMPPPPTNGNDKRHHAAMAWQDVPTFIAELRDRESVSARALEFTILTAARTGETIGATWSEIDFDAKTWVIPATRMKAARKHSVPLSAPVVELLTGLHREADNPFLFIGARAGASLSNMAMLVLVRGMRSGLTVHGFRAAFKTWCDETQHVENAVVEAALAHLSGDKVERAYKRGDNMLTKRAKLMADWADYCASKPAVDTSLAERRKAKAS